MYVPHGLDEEPPLELIHVPLIVVTLSILLHGTSLKPLPTGYWRENPTKKTKKDWSETG